MRKPWWPFGLRLSEGLGPTSPEREDFERWFFASKYAQVKIPRSDEVQIAWDTWQAATAAERERAARVCDDEARIRTEAGNTHPEDSDSRGRCFAAARAAINCAKGVRGGEVVGPNARLSGAGTASA